jgi:hypothetical protein
MLESTGGDVGLEDRNTNVRPIEICNATPAVSGRCACEWRKRRFVLAVTDNKASIQKQKNESNWWCESRVWGDEDGVRAVDA